MALLLFQQQGAGRVAASHYEGDASAAGQLWAKLLYRRALARKDLGKFKDALAVRGTGVQGCALQDWVL